MNFKIATPAWAATIFSEENSWMFERTNGIHLEA